MFQKIFLASVKDTNLTMGQPKVLDYLRDNNGAVQKDIAAACHIEQASLTSVLAGMEKKGLITRQMCEGNRRSLYVFLTEKGKELSERIDNEFCKLEENALKGFSREETDKFINFLSRIYENMHRGKQNKEEDLS